MMYEKSCFGKFVLSFETMCLTLREQLSSKCVKTMYKNSHTYFNFTELQDAGSSDGRIKMQQCIQVAD
jgi:hypothetical protein